MYFERRRDFCGKRSKSLFSDTLLRQVEIVAVTLIFKADFPVVQIRRRMILKNPPISAPKPGFSKKYAKEGAEVQTPAPLF